MATQWSQTIFYIGVALDQIVSYKLTHDAVVRASPRLRLPVASGDRRIIVAYVSVDGTCPVKDFLDGLDPSAQQRYAVHFRSMCDHGQLHGKYHHQWDSKKDKNAKDFSCFKDNQTQTRIPCFPSGEPKELVLTHGFWWKKRERAR